MDRNPSKLAHAKPADAYGINIHLLEHKMVIIFVASGPSSSDLAKIPWFDYQGVVPRHCRVLCILGIDQGTLTRVRRSEA